jgi:hypothetical protein
MGNSSMNNHVLPLASDVSYGDFVNPQWLRLLDLMQMNVRYGRCLGAELFTADGRRILDRARLRLSRRGIVISTHAAHAPSHPEPESTHDFF